MRAPSKVEDEVSDEKSDIICTSSLARQSNSDESDGAEVGQKEAEQEAAVVVEPEAAVMREPEAEVEPEAGVEAEVVVHPEDDQTVTEEEQTVSEQEQEQEQGGKLQKHAEHAHQQEQEKFTQRQ